MPLPVKAIARALAQAGAAVGEQVILLAPPEATGWGSTIVERVDELEPRKVTLRTVAPLGAEEDGVSDAQQGGVVSVTGRPYVSRAFVFSTAGLPVVPRPGMALVAPHPVTGEATRYEIPEGGVKTTAWSVVVTGRR